MKKYILFAGIIGLCALKSFSQSPLGYEGNQFKLASGYTTEGIPVFLAYEMGIPDILTDFTFGMEAAYRSYKESTDSATLNHSIVGFSFFGNYYFNSLFNLDPRKNFFVYAGASLGYYKWFSPDNYFEKGKSTSTLAAGAQIGAQYYFKDWGVYLEAAGGSENIGGKLGVIYRFDY